MDTRKSECACMREREKREREREYCICVVCACVCTKRKNVREYERESLHYRQKMRTSEQRTAERQDVKERYLRNIEEQ